LILCSLNIWNNHHLHKDTYPLFMSLWISSQHIIPSNIISLSQVRPCIANVIWRFPSLCAKWVNVKSDCSVCWYWWNYWPLLFIIDHYCLLLTIAVYYWPLLFIINHYCLLLPITVYYWPLLFIIGHCCLLLTITVYYWPFTVYFLFSSFSCSSNHGRKTVLIWRLCFTLIHLRYSVRNECSTTIGNALVRYAYRNWT
jgi:hypothetical protein